MHFLGLFLNQTHGQVILPFVFVYYLTSQKNDLKIYFERKNK